ncbi:hypothetical protein [Streptomyces sp. CRB46]|uniref:hypothetical protein n=1 Tax=Streptomyces sp. CRB46 TaxID=2682613 RepID=UPI0018F7BA64|nr:hypothetical protein [Streptomyces sp. CRB46]
MSTSIRKSAAAAACGVLLAVGGVTATATAAEAEARGEARAQACLDNPKSYTKAEGQRYSGVYTATSACADINLKPNTNRYVAVCFKPSSGGDVCQSSYKLMTGGRWNVIATNVADGTRFYFDFRSTARSTGQWAA